MPDALAAPVVHGAGAGLAEDPFPGVHRETHQTERATVTAYTFAPGAAFPAHVHVEEQITVVLDGDVEFTVSGEVHVLGPGETYAVAGGLPHSLRAGGQGARFLAVIVPRRTRPDAYEIKE